MSLSLGSAPRNVKFQECEFCFGPRKYKFMLAHRTSKWNHLREERCARFKLPEQLVDGQLTVGCSSLDWMTLPACQCCGYNQHSKSLKTRKQVFEMGIGMQPTEQEGEIFLLVADETYDSGEISAQDSERYRLGLEKEFGVKFTEANIGPALICQHFLLVLATTTVPLWSLLLGAFFLGKPINENLDAWHTIGKRLRQFFKRPVYLSRNSAAVIAVEAVFEDIGGMPKTLRLCGYRISHLDERGIMAQMPQEKKSLAA